MLPQNDNQQITVAIIAGGKSSRFGSQKAYARLHGIPLIEYAIQIARQVSERVMIIAANENDFQGVEVPVFTDIIPERGPLGGLFAALSYAETPFIATLPCDLPLLPPEIYLILMKKTQQDRPVVAVSHLGIEPLVAVWPKTILSYSQEALNCNQLKLHSFLKGLKAIDVFIPVETPGYCESWFANINTQDDLDDVEKAS